MHYNRHRLTASVARSIRPSTRQLMTNRPARLLISSWQIKPWQYCLVQFSPVTSLCARLKTRCSDAPVSNAGRRNRNFMTWFKTQFRPSITSLFFSTVQAEGFTVGANLVPIINRNRVIANKAFFFFRTFRDPAFRTETVAPAKIKSDRSFVGSHSSQNIQHNHSNNSDGSSLQRLTVWNLSADCKSLNGKPVFRLLYTLLIYY